MAVVVEVVVILLIVVAGGGKGGNHGTRVAGMVVMVAETEIKVAAIALVVLVW